MGKQHRYTYIREQQRPGVIVVTLFKNGMQLYSDRYTGYFGVAWWKARRRVAEFRRIYRAEAA